VVACVFWVPWVLWVLWVPLVLWVLMASGVRVIVQGEFRRRDAGAQNPVGVHVPVPFDSEAAERRAKLLERQADIEERTEHHVARSAGEAIEVERTTHRYPSSLKLR
jgi:hypothetical protein